MSACSGGGGAADAAVEPDAAPEEGTVTVSWQLSDGANTLSCEDVGALNLSVTATPVEGGSGFADGFVCDLGTGTTAPIKAGVYTVELTLVGSGNEPLTDAYRFTGVEIPVGENVTLEEVTFEITPQGNLTFHIDTEEIGANCETEAGGAGITEMAIEFLDSQGECVPATFEIEAGAEHAAGTYEADCAGATYACIEQDQLLRVEGLPSGQSSMVITGYKGTEVCYTRSSLFTVPGADRTLELSPQQLKRNEEVAECDPYAARETDGALTR